MPGQPARDGHKEFLQGPRLPGALFWDIDNIVTRGESVMNLPNMMPSTSMFADAAGKHGITRDTHVVVYDRQGIFSSPRAAFTFAAFGHKTISVLDGGLPAWIAAGQDIDAQALTADPSVEETKYEQPSLLNGWIRSFEEMLHNTTLGSRAQLVLDARPKPRFEAGHIPHSFSLPQSSLLDTQTSGDSTYTTLKSQQDLWKVITGVVGEDGIEKLRHDASSQGSLGVSLTCGSGMTAATIWLALQQLGINGAIYDESWSGWGRRAQNGEAPVEKSE
ncbi:thiosulfate sulfurtransferase [Malassezia pachydermatis]